MVNPVLCHTLAGRLSAQGGPAYRLLWLMLLKHMPSGLEVRACCGQHV